MKFSWPCAHTLCVPSICGCYDRCVPSDYVKHLWRTDEQSSLSNENNNIMICQHNVSKLNFQKLWILHRKCSHDWITLDLNLADNLTSWSPSCPCLRLIPTGFRLISDWFWLIPGKGKLGWFQYKWDFSPHLRLDESRLFYWFTSLLQVLKIWYSWTICKRKGHILWP